MLSGAAPGLCSVMAPCVTDAATPTAWPPRLTPSLSISNTPVLARLPPCSAMRRTTEPWPVSATISTTALALPATLGSKPSCSPRLLYVGLPPPCCGAPSTVDPDASVAVKPLASPMKRTERIVRSPVPLLPR